MLARTAVTLSYLFLLMSITACSDEQNVEATATKTVEAAAPSSKSTQTAIPSSPTVLEFADAETLFVADSARGSIVAYKLPESSQSAAQPAAWNLLDLDALLIDELGAAPRGIKYHDLAVHPKTQEAYISLSASVGGKAQSMVVAVSREGAAMQLDLESLPSQQFVLENPADDGVSFWRDIPAASFTVTDLDYRDGELYVSGLSTGEFASTLRRVPFPFTDSNTSTGVEMYHAAHGQMETRAPIRAMSIVDLNGVPSIVAAYTCTPLVTVPIEDLADGTKITGRTVAELGYGNTPLEVLSFETANMQGQTQSFVLVINREKNADLIALDQLAEAANAPGLSDPIPYLGATAGVATIPIPLSGVFQAADQDAQFLLTLRRNMDTGAMDLVSFRKGAYLRLSEFVSEYNFPDYVYEDGKSAQGTKMFQNMLKADEGFPELAR